MAGSGDDDSPGDDYFNDLSQQPTKQSDGGQDDGANGQIPKVKRIACVLCRKRKLKCDGNKPSCGTCTRLQHECSYDEARKKSGPKRGYVKALEARLAQVETLLKTQDDPPAGAPKSNGAAAVDIGMTSQYGDMSLGNVNGNILLQPGQESAAFPHDIFDDINANVLPPEEPFSWEMIGLGLDEPLPTSDVINELNQVFFERIHPSFPMIHRPRYYAAMNLAPHMRPPVCLRYAMWCHAASVIDKYEPLAQHFYARARKYIQQDEMKGHGESMITIAHAQTWILLAGFEFKLMYFPRAWMSSGRGTRMVQMMGLHRVDGAGLDVKQCLPPPRDWTDREERRRTFWMAFCVDRYSSIGTGWPMTIVEQDIASNLPSDEQSYELSKQVKGLSLEAALSPEGTPNLTSAGGVVLMACLFGRNLIHLHRPAPDDDDNDLDGGFWKRHRELDNVLLNIALALPDSMRLPICLNDANAVYMNMCIHTSTICLHQAAIYKADKNRMPSRVSAESKVRCITAAAETASIMRTISHLDLTSMNPFLSFCLYVAARVFVQYLKSRPKDTQIHTSLQFLLAAMQAFKRKNPLTESFLVQLDVDLESAGLNDSQAVRGSINMPKYPVRGEGCPVSQMGVGENFEPSYTNVGAPGVGVGQDCSPLSKNVPTFGDSNLPGFAPESTMEFIPGTMNTYDLPSHVRSPASNPGSSMHQSPQSFNPDMETSPDGSAGVDTLSPHSSSNQSQHNSSSTHTSHTGYTPPPGHHQQHTYQHQPQQQQYNDTPGRLTGPSLFDPNDTAFPPHDFEMATNLYPAPSTITNTNNHSTSTPSTTHNAKPSAFPLSNDWADLGGDGGGGAGVGSTGFTPAGQPSTAFTPGAMDTMSEMMGLSDAEFNAMMDTMNFNAAAWQHANASGVTDAM